MKAQEVYADEKKIEQVLLNFVENAVKYAPDTGVIQIRVEHVGNVIRISIKDKGPGILADQLPHIFKRYFRAKNGALQTGIGLGLYVCAEIVKQHGGEIGLESEPGNGSIFWFTLPVNGS